MDAAHITQVAMLLRVLIIMVLVIMGRERERDIGYLDWLLWLHNWMVKLHVQWA